jgi:hypothetical protein
MLFSLLRDLRWRELHVARRGVGNLGCRGLLPGDIQLRLSQSPVESLPQDPNS